MKTFRTLARDYNPQSWTGNGPEMLTSTIRSFCDNKDILQNNYTTCDNFTAIPCTKCYPLHFRNWEYFYEEKYRDDVLDILTKEGSYFVHVWNKMHSWAGDKYKLAFNANTAYVQLAKVYCPKSYETIVKYL
jgi:hypothetical protein